MNHTLGGCLIKQFVNRLQLGPSRIKFFRLNTGLKSLDSRLDTGFCRSISTSTNQGLSQTLLSTLNIRHFLKLLINDLLQSDPQGRAPNHCHTDRFCPVLFYQKQLPARFRKTQPFRLPMANSQNLGQTVSTRVFFEAKCGPTSRKSSWVFPRFEAYS